MDTKIKMRKILFILLIVLSFSGKAQDDMMFTLASQSTVDWTIVDMSYASITKNISAQTGSSTDFFIGNNGTALYVMSSSVIYQYTMSTAWNVSTATYNRSYTFTDGFLTAGEAVWFKSDGTEMYILSTNSNIHEFPLSSEWDLSTVSAYTSYAFYSNSSTPRDIWMNSNGTKVYIVGTTVDDINYFTLSSAWNPGGTPTYQNDMNVTTQDNLPMGIFLSPTGMRLFLVGSTNDRVYQYSTNTPWSMAVLEYDDWSVLISSYETAPCGLFISPDGTKLYILGTSSDTIHQFTITAGS